MKHIQLKQTKGGGIKRLVNRTNEQSSHVNNSSLNFFLITWKFSFNYPGSVKLTCFIFSLEKNTVHCIFLSFLYSTIHHLILEKLPQILTQVILYL